MRDLIWYENASDPAKLLFIVSTDPNQSFKKLSDTHCCHVADGESSITREMLTPRPGKLDYPICCHGVPLKLLQNVKNGVFSANPGLRCANKTNVD